MKSPSDWLDFDFVQMHKPLRDFSGSGWHLACVAALENRAAKEAKGADPKMERFHRDRMNGAIALMTDEDREMAREARRG